MKMSTYTSAAMGDKTLAKTPTEYVSEHAGVITSVLAAITAIGVAIRALIKLYRARRAQVLEVLEMPGKMTTQFTDVHGQLSVLKAFGDVTREALRVATWECDTKGYCIEASPALCDLFGQTKEQMLGRGWLESIPNNTERDEAWGAWSDSVNNHIPYRDHYPVRNLRTGTIKHCATTSVTVHDAEGAVVRYIGYVVEQMPEGTAQQQ